MDEQFERIEEIIGAGEDFELGAAVEKYCAHLRQHLILPCEVTGMEDFNWEEFYVIGPRSRREYDELQKTQPSYRDRYDLKEIEYGPVSRWMLFGGDDIAAQVRRQKVHPGSVRAESGQ